MDRQTYYNLGFLTTLLAMSGLLVLQRDELSRLKEKGNATALGQPTAKRNVTIPAATLHNLDVHKSRPERNPNGTVHPAEAPQAYEQQLASLQNQVSRLQEQVASGPAKRQGMRQDPEAASSLGSMPLSGLIPVPRTASSLKGPTWNHAQATGKPDTEGAGDLPTAWAPKSPQSGEQWLQLGYDSPVEIGAINVLETHHPGALSRVTALMPDGTEREIWSGSTPAGEAPVETSVPVPRGITSNQIRLYVDTNRVQSWPEIDAVELVGTDGSRQWASSSSASSSYHEAEAPTAPEPER